MSKLFLGVCALACGAWFSAGLTHAALRMGNLSTMSPTACVNTPSCTHCALLQSDKALRVIPRAVPARNDGYGLRH